MKMKMKIKIILLLFFNKILSLKKEREESDTVLKTEKIINQPKLYP